MAVSNFPIGREDHRVVQAEYPFDRIIDETDANCIYIGFAAIGSDVASAHWNIQRIKKTGNITYIGWNNATNKYTGIWNDRATYTYTQG